MKKDKLKFDIQYFAEPEGDNPEPEEKEEPETEDEEKEKEGEVETFTKEQVEEIVKSRLEREAKKREKAVAEAEKLAKMNADEKKAYEFEKLQKELEDYKNKDRYNSLSKEATKMLAEKEIIASDEILAFVVKEDAEATKTSVEVFCELINAKVEEGVRKALAGQTPSRNNAGQALTREKIMEIKDPEERQKMIKENMNLFI